MTWEDVDCIKMGLNTYAHYAKDTIVNPDKQDWLYFALEVCDEAGEVAGKVKKIIRDQDGHIKPHNIEALKGEIGDVLWPLAMLAHALGLSFGTCAVDNLKKLQDRKARGVLKGSGDNR